MLGGFQELKLGPPVRSRQASSEPCESGRTSVRGNRLQFDERRAGDGAYRQSRESHGETYVLENGIERRGRQVRRSVVPGDQFMRPARRSSESR